MCVSNSSNCSSSIYLLFPENFENFRHFCLHPIEKAAIIEQWKIDSASRCFYLARGSGGSFRFAFPSLPLRSWLGYPALPSCPISSHNHLCLLTVLIKLHFGDTSHCLRPEKVFAFSLCEVLENGLFPPLGLFSLAEVTGDSINFAFSSDCFQMCWHCSWISMIRSMMATEESMRTPAPRATRWVRVQTLTSACFQDIRWLLFPSTTNYEDSRAGPASVLAPKSKQDISAGLGKRLCSKMQAQNGSEHLKVQH